jgi:acyl-Coa thioesterase superfamily protein
VTWLKRGKTTATARAALIQDGEQILDVVVSTGTVPASTGDASTGDASPGDASPGPATAAGDGPASSQTLAWTGPMPAFPALQDCVELGPWRGSVAEDGAQGYALNVRVLFDPATVGWQSRQPSGEPEIRGYFGLREDRDPDAYLLALAVDGLPPVVFGLGATGWAPTVELTWYMRAVPAPGPLAVAARARHVGGGWFDEEAEVWDAAGRLVAQSRQLARVGRGPLRRPPATGRS